MADVIGSLRVLLGVDTAAFSEGLTKAEKSLQSFSKSFNAIGVAAGAALGVAVTAVAASVTHMINEADKMNKASQKFGVPVETLSALKYAADLADVSFESLGKGLSKLSKAMFDGLVNPGGEAAKTFNALGIAVKDSSGNLKSTDVIFAEVADKFAKMDDGAAKTALSIKLFGRAGADLIPLLNQGSAGIKAMTDEAAKLGIVISADTAAKAEQFNDTLKKIGLSFNAIGLRIAEALLPHLQSLANIFFGLAQQGSSLSSFFKNLITEEDLREVQRYGQYWENVVRIWNVLKNVKPTDTIGQTRTALTAAIEENRKALDGLEKAFKQTGLSAFTEMDNLGGALPKVTKGLGDLNTAALGTKNAFDRFLDSQHKALAAAQAHAQTVGATAGAYAFLKTTLEGIAITEANGIVITNARKDALIAAANAAGLAAAEMSAAKHIEEAIPEWQKLEDKIRNIGQEMELLPDKAEQLKIALAKTQEAIVALALTAVASGLGGISQLFMELGKKNKQLFEIGKGLAIAEAIIKTYLAANVALASAPPPFNYIAMAGVIAAGIANVIKIQSTKFQGAAFGGSFRVPGGMSSVDSKLVPMMLAPGERVDVTPASRAGVDSRELIIPPIKPKDLFTGEIVREMVMSIDQWMKDGGTGIRFAQ